MHRLVVLSLIAVLSLTGCSTAVARPAPKPTPASAHSVQQWASKVAEQKVSLDKWSTQWAADGCTADALPDLPCGMEILTGTMIATTISLNLHTLSKEYGSPPDEIKSLVADTQTAADAANTSGQTWTSTCNAKQDPSCLQLSFAFTTTMDALSTKFTAWSPYLG
jgi:uncharacterized protein YceK